MTSTMPNFHPSLHLSLISKGYLLMFTMCFYHIHLVSQNGQDLIAAKKR